MVLESLINPFKAEKKPWEMFFIGILYNSIAIVLSLWVFESQASLVMVFLTVLACVPLVYSTIKMEEEYDVKVEKELSLLKEHGRVLLFFVFLFLGIMFSVSMWYTFLPQAVHPPLFNIQTQTIQTINQQVTGNAIETSAVFLKILIFSLFFYCPIRDT
jgi:hypothetical protein